MFITSTKIDPLVTKKQLLARTIAPRIWLAIFWLGLLFPLIAQAQIPGNDIRNCAGTCNANDVTVTNVFVADANGNPLSACTIGQIVNATLFIQMTNNSNGNRSALRFGADLYINGMDSGTDILQCWDGPLITNTTNTFTYGALSYTCGQTLELRNIKVAWRTSASATCANSTSCNNYPNGQCWQPNSNITIATTPIASFTFACAGFRTIAFDNTSFGGFQPITFAWDFGDGNTSTAINPTHTYASNGPFIVSLTMTDAQQQIYTTTASVNPGSCCQLEVTCPSQPTALFDCNNPIPAAVANALDFEALPGAALGDNPCGQIMINSSTTPINKCTTSVVTRTYTIWDDLPPFNGILDNLEASQICTLNYSYSSDKTPPIITCPASTTVSCASNVPVPNTASVTASDNCGGTPTVTLLDEDITNQTCANRFTVVRNYRATDECGNSAACSQFITVNDQTPPSITCPASTTVSCASNVPAPATTSVTASDNCGGTPTVTLLNEVITNQTCANRFTVIRNYRATDECGNSAACSQFITVNDQTAPSIICPASTTVSCASNVPAPNTASVTASDNCGGTPTITHVGDVTSNQTCANRFTVTRTYRATDVCGNSATCSHTITVNDQTPPTLTVPANTTVDCSFVPGVGTATAIDNCNTGNTTVVFLGEVRNDGTCPTLYTLTRTWRATDACGNSTTRAQVVTVTDTNAPVFVENPDHILVECNATNQDQLADYLANFGGAVVEDCSEITYSYQQISESWGCGNTFGLRFRFTATDECGNSSSRDGSFTVQDLTPPVFVQLPQDITVEVVPGLDCPQEFFDWKDDFAGAEVTDNCGNVELEMWETKHVDQCAGGFVKTFLFRATDECGNTATATASFTYRDLTPPSISPNLPDSVIVSCHQDIPSANDLLYFVQNYLYDECGIAKINIFWEYTDKYCGMRRTFSFNVEDPWGNTSEVRTIIFISDGGLCGDLCTNTDADWGNPGALFGSTTVSNAISAYYLEYSKLRAGGQNRGITFANGGIFDQILPADGSNFDLPFGQTMIAAGPLPAALLNVDNRLNNELLGNVIALELNIAANLEFHHRLLGSMGLNMWPACAIAPSVQAAMGNHATVYSLLALANRALDGQSVSDAPNFEEDLLHALSTINMRWAGCSDMGLCNAGAQDRATDSGWEQQLFIAPNPAVRSVQLTILAQQDGKANIRLIGTAGVAREENTVLVKGSNLLELDLAHVSAGTYTVAVQLPYAVLYTRIVVLSE